MLDLDCDALLKRREGWGHSTDPATHDKDARTIRLLFVIHATLHGSAHGWSPNSFASASWDVRHRAAKILKGKTLSRLAGRERCILETEPGTHSVSARRTQR